jgi:type I restriction enzyme S subunit
MTVAGWTTETVEGCLAQISFASATKLQTKDYRTHGTYPIVDQGLDLIAGWTDCADGVISSPLPLVVFGDHTRTFKFVDFPFVRGADGTQLLRPRPGIDPRYFFYACRAVNLPSRGYNRHFSVLKEKEIPLPPLDEQRDIAAVLRHVEAAISVQAQQLAAATAVKRSAMRGLFASGMRRETQKETPIGPVPMSWEVDRLDRWADVISTRMSYSDLQGLVPAVSDYVTVLGIKVSDMNLPGNETTLVRSALMVPVERTVAAQRCAPPGSIIFPKRGAAIATNKKRLASEWTVFDPNVIGVVARENVNHRFLFHWFQDFDLRTITEPGPTPQLNKKNLEPLLVPMPQAIDEQRDIVAVLDAIDRKHDLHNRKRVVLDDLFSSLLHDLTTGDVRVADLDQSTLHKSLEQTAGAAA